MKTIAAIACSVGAFGLGVVMTSLVYQASMERQRHDNETTRQVAIGLSQIIVAKGDLVLSREVLALLEAKNVFGATQLMESFVSDKSKQIEFWTSQFPPGTELPNLAKVHLDEGHPTATARFSIPVEH